MVLSNIFIYLIVILLAMVVHEFSHGLMAYFLGDETAKKQGRLTLNPFAHMDPFISFILPFICAITGAPVVGGAKPIPVNERELKGGKWGVALVALAGPISNLILAFVSFAIVRALNGSAPVLSVILNYGVLVNLSLMLFNLIPFPPLDGSKIIYPIAPEFVQKWFDKAEQSTMFILFAAMFLFSQAISSFVLIGQSLILQIFIFILG